ncbi:hypothetical protein [Salinibacter ruber]|uniref:hypothetical protein n=1 Tax=Salinibacter ruber TaxID=146919 RepID=UPI0011AF133D|nr:hypothetical protein [Salinibacter ruber]MCS3675252.1 hypothetical protein [Salinibacter ruber]
MANLLHPGNFFKDNYLKQVRQTINAYSPTKKVIGEPIQNSIDAICRRENIEKGKIGLTLDIDNREVKVEDNGRGFPKKLSYLYLGGGDKEEGASSKGAVGVGVKVTLFSSTKFQLRANLGNEESWKIEVEDAHDFEEKGNIQIEHPLPEDPDPLGHRGTKLKYRFPNDEIDPVIACLREIDASVTSDHPNKGYGAFLQEYEDDLGYPSPLATCIASFLKRFTYAGDVLQKMDKQSQFPDGGIEISVDLRCSNEDLLPGELRKLHNGSRKEEFDVDCSYLTVENTREWVPKGKKEPEIFSDEIGPGGKNLSTTNGFNVLYFDEKEEYESLLRNKNRNTPSNTEYFEDKLFDSINGIIITMGRIPDLNRFLPGASRRFISANGVPTKHDIDITRGRNQEYVRCLDIVVDVDAELNYGKNALKNNHMVSYVREYVNHAYLRSLQDGTGQWVGTMPSPNGDEEDLFTDKEDIGESLTTWKVPRDENDVIGLFFELAGMNIIDDLRMFGLSQIEQYDGKATFQKKDEDKSVLSAKDDSQLRVVEFKVHASEVMRDFERNQKYPKDINLLVSWDIGDYDGDYYSVYNIEESNMYDSSPPSIFDNVNKYIYDAQTGEEVQLLLLKEVVNNM